MTTLPYAPLTLAELNVRVHQAQAEIAWTVAHLLLGGGGLTDGDTDRLRDMAERLESYHAAAYARVRGES